MLPLVRGPGDPVRLPDRGRRGRFGVHDFHAIKRPDRPDAFWRRNLRTAGGRPESRAPASPGRFDRTLASVANVRQLRIDH